MRKTIKAGFIGDGNQSIRIQNYLEKKYKQINIIYFLHRKKKIKQNYTFEIQSLLDCDIIFICSPNQTHFKYLKKFLNKKFIFCEKPPVSNLNQIKFLEKYDNGKVYYNYNMRFSKVYNFIKDCEKYKIGKLIDGEITFTHALGLQKKYKMNWRSNRLLSKKGVYEVVSIHALDLVLSLFKDIEIISNKFSTKSKLGTSIDSALTLVKVNKDSFIKIFTSYCAPYNYKIRFIYENAIIEINENKLKLFYPGVVINSKNITEKPKLFKVIKYNRSEDYSYSLHKSIDKFVNNFKNNKKFNNKRDALKSNKLIF